MLSGTGSSASIKIQVLFWSLLPFSRGNVSITVSSVGYHETFADISSVIVHRPLRETYSQRKLLCSGCRSRYPDSDWAFRTQGFADATIEVRMGVTRLVNSNSNTAQCSSFPATCLWARRTLVSPQFLMIWIMVVRRIGPSGSSPAFFRTATRSRLVL